MSDRAFATLPAYVPTTTAAILAPPGLSGGVINGGNFPTSVYAGVTLMLRHIRVVNSTTGAVTISLWVNTSGTDTGGTEFAWSDYSIPANSYVDWYGYFPLEPGWQLAGSSGLAEGLTITIEGEMRVS